MMAIAPRNPELARSTSFMQVEYGLDELKASWDGFVDTSKHYSIEFKTRKHLCNEFAKALAEYIIYLEPKSYEMGFAFSPDCQ